MVCLDSKFRCVCDADKDGNNMLSLDEIVEFLDTPEGPTLDTRVTLHCAPVPPCCTVQSPLSPSSIQH